MLRLHSLRIRPEATPRLRSARCPHQASPRSCPPPTDRPRLHAASARSVRRPTGPTSWSWSGAPLRRARRRRETRAPRRRPATCSCSSTPTSWSIATPSATCAAPSPPTRRSLRFSAATTTRPSGEGVVSAFRDLLHHHVHHQSAGPGRHLLGGARGDQARRIPRCRRFRRGPVPRPVDRGRRARHAPPPGRRADRAGTRPPRHPPEALDAAADGAHGPRSPAAPRGSRSCSRERSHSTALNLGWRHRLGAATAVGVAWLAARRRPLAASCALGAFVLVNRPFHALLWRRQGPLGAAAGVGLHLVHHLTSAAAVPLGAAVYARERLGRGAPARTASQR